jgi:hypothetical protein
LLFAAFSFVFAFRFTSFLHMTRLDGCCMVEIVGHAWWDSNGVDQKVEQNKAAYFAACQKIEEAVASNELLLE